MAAATASRVPWQPRDVHRTVLVLVLAIVLLGVSGWNAGGSADVNRQLGWVVAAVLALIGIGFGNFWWLHSARRRVRLRTTALLDKLSVPASASWITEVDVPAETDERRVTLSGSTRFHRATCILVEGKRWALVADRGRLEPCEMCEP